MRSPFPAVLFRLLLIAAMVLGALVAAVTLTVVYFELTSDPSQERWDLFLPLWGTFVVPIPLVAFAAGGLVGETTASYAFRHRFTRAVPLRAIQLVVASLAVALGAWLATGLGFWTGYAVVLGIVGCLGCVFAAVVTEVFGAVARRREPDDLSDALLTAL